MIWAAVASAIYDDEIELQSALERTGLDKDKLWSSVGLYSIEADTVLKCARDGLGASDTIRAIHQARAEHEARRLAREELEERATLEKLLNKYGVPESFRN